MAHVSTGTAPAAVDADGIEERLLGTRLQQVLLELTSKCNLRCIYCAVSQPFYVGRELELERAEIVNQLVALGPIEFQLNGHGETTLIKGWDELARDLLDRGLALTLISHLNKDMSDAEIDVMARLKMLTVSCDTIDPAVYQRLRRGGRLERVAQNLRRILERCRSEGLPKPYIAINCTTTHINVLGIPDLVRMAAEMGLACVSLTNLVEYPEIPGCERPLHPAEVDPQGALAAVRHARELAQGFGIDYHVMGDLEDSLEQALRRRGVA
ncbi:MAG: radical SAM protein [Planctomycetota bacterium]